VTAVTAAAARRRPTPHRYFDDPDARGTCRRCHLIRANDVHAAPEPDVVFDHARAAAGERDETEEAPPRGGAKGGTT
jgi:hypothetical protein